MLTPSLLIILTATASGSPLFVRADPDTTGSSERVSWVAPSRRRSTMDIAWTCLTVFIICSWRCLHLNLPTPEESRGRCYTFRLWIWKVPYWPDPLLRRKWLRKLIWMATIIIAPEYGVLIAADHRLSARSTLRNLRARLLPDEASRYTMAHAFCTQMGGIAIRTPEVSQKTTEPEKLESQEIRTTAEGEENLDYFVCTLGTFARGDWRS